MSTTFSRITDNLEKSTIRKVFDKALPDSINLGLGEIQFPLPSFLKKAAYEIIDNEEIRYTPNAGLTSLRKRVAQYYDDIIPWQNTCITVGAEEALYLVLAVLINPGDEVLISDPAYPAYKTLIRLRQGNAVIFKRRIDDNFIIDFNDLKNSISQKTKAIIISNPSNPLSTCLKKEEISSLISICEENDVYLIIDEIYRELYINKPIKSLLQKSKKVIVISGLSKSHCLSGWRLGWIVSQEEELIQRIIKYHQYLVTCASYISQRLAEKALSDEGMNLVKINRVKLQKNYYFCKNYISNHFSNINMIESDAAPYLFVNINRDALIFCENLLQKRVIVMPGIAFGDICRNWIRINYAIEETVLEKAIQLLFKEIIYTNKI